MILVYFFDCVLTLAIRCEIIYEINKEGEATNKQELIDRCVDEWLKVGALVCVKANKQVLTVDRITEENGVSCSNFKAYCRTELEPYGDGWINGCKFGAEYPTNGKKPDLPDGTVIERYSWTDDGPAWHPPIEIQHLTNWGNIDDFIIVDESYKPKESHGKPSVDGAARSMQDGESNKVFITSMQDNS